MNMEVSGLPGIPTLPSSPIPPTLKTSRSLLVTSFLALCFQGIRKALRAGSIQRSPWYLPLLTAFTSQGPNRSFWASLRARGRQRGANRGHTGTETREGPGDAGVPLTLRSAALPWCRGVPSPAGPGAGGCSARGAPPPAWPFYPPPPLAPSFLEIT